MTRSDEPIRIGSLLPGSGGRLLGRWATSRLKRVGVLRGGIGDVVRGAREGDRLRQMIGWTIIGVGVYQKWKRSQTPSLLYSAYLDMDESIGIRVLQKGRVVGEFPVGRVGG
jgi:hypothetical protein